MRRCQAPDLAFVPPLSPPVLVRLSLCCRRITQEHPCHPRSAAPTSTSQLRPTTITPTSLDTTSQSSPVQTTTPSTSSANTGFSVPPSTSSLAQATGLTTSPGTTSPVTLYSSGSQAQATGSFATSSVTLYSTSSQAQATGSFTSPVTTSSITLSPTSAPVQATGSSTSSVTIIVAALLGALAALSLGLIITRALKRKRNNAQTSATILRCWRRRLRARNQLESITPFRAVERGTSSRRAKAPVAAGTLSPNAATSSRAHEQMSQIQHTPEPRGSVLDISNENRVNLQRESRDLGRESYRDVLIHQDAGSLSRQEAGPLELPPMYDSIRD